MSDTDHALPPAQDAGQMPANTDLQTNPPVVPPPLTSTTGTAFNTPDAGTITPHSAAPAAPMAAGTVTPLPPTDSNTMPQVGNIDRDALVGESASPGAQADAEAVASTGPSDTLFAAASLFSFYARNL